MQSWHAGGVERASWSRYLRVNDSGKTATVLCRRNRHSEPQRERQRAVGHDGRRAQATAILIAGERAGKGRAVAHEHVHVGDMRPIWSMRYAGIRWEEGHVDRDRR